MRYARLALILILVGPAAESADFYVSPTGEGTTCTKQRPCGLNDAVSVVRAAAVKQREEIRVNLLDGLYRLERPVELTVADSGRNGNKIVWQAAAGAKPTLSGGISLKQWTLFDPARNIWRTDAPSGNTSRQLFVNGRRAARTSTGDLMAGYSSVDNGFLLKDSVFQNPVDISGFRNLQDVEVVRLFNWQLSRCNVVRASTTKIDVHPICFFNSKEANLGIFVENAFELLHAPGEWYLDRRGAIGGKPSVFYIPREKESMQTASAYIPGIEQLLTLKGESAETPIHDIVIRGIGFTHATWFIERSLAGRVGGYAGLQAGVHLLNPADFLAQDASSKILPQPPSVVGGFYDPVNLAYEAYLPSIVTVDYGRKIAFLENTFTHLGGTALALVHGIQDARIVGNVFSDVSGSAIQLGGIETEDHHPCGDVPSCDNGRVTQNNVISNNRIVDVSNEYLDSVAIFVGYVRNTEINNNELSDLPYSGISVGWGWGWSDKDAFFGFKNPTVAGNNRIVNNRITRFLTRQRDGAAIYTLSSQPNSVIANNFATEGKHDFAGVYQDEGSSGFTVENNVITKVKNTILINCNRNDITHDNTYRNNYSDTGAVHNSCGKSKNSIEPPVVFTNRFTDPKDWPDAVRAIAESSGLEAEYKKAGKVTAVEFTQ